MQVVHSGEYTTGPMSGNVMYVDGRKKLYATQEFLLMSTTHTNWYKIKQQATGKFITIHSPAVNQSVYLETNGYNSKSDLQEFQFVAQTEPGRYRIHTRYSVGGVDLLLEVDPANFGLSGLRLGKNISVGNSEHQKFDLDLLYPASDPSTATPSLANRFEGRTFGFTMKHNGFQLTTSSSDAVYQTPPYSGFNQKFKIEYTNETGWYKILHKASGKYLTVVMAASGADIALKPDVSYDDNYQKFKFIVQLNDSTYKIHTKFSSGLGTNKVAMVLEAPVSTTDSIRVARNITGSDANQQFIIRKNLVPAAQFTAGAPISSNVTNGKILSRTYHISSRESYALLEPIIVGVDTFIRVQQSPVYTDQSEWVFDLGINDNGTQYVRIRYGKTGQYIYLKTASGNIGPLPGEKLRLKKDTSFTNPDKRFQFSLVSQTANNFFEISSGVGNINTLYRTLEMNDDGYLSADDGLGVFFSAVDKQLFCINLSFPVDASKMYSINTSNQGHFISDSGILAPNAAVTHIKYSDFSCMWHFVPTADGYYWLRNHLTKQYLYTNGSASAGAELKMTGDSLVAGTKWRLIRDANFYNIQNVYSGKYFALMNHPGPGQPLYQANAGASGSRFIILRADFSKDANINATQSGGLLSPAYILSQNPLISISLTDKMMRNIGFPFEPSLLIPLGATTPLAIQSLQSEGISSNPIPSFYAVVRSALTFKFNYSSAQVDSAMSNYKIDTPGHRVQACYALRSYILENLALRPRTTWTFNERELVAWMERKIKHIKTDFASRLQTSWNNWIISSAQNNLPFTNLLYGPTAEGFEEPSYYITTEQKLKSLAEYASIAKAKQYKNPPLLIESLSAGLETGSSLIATVITAYMRSQYLLSFENPGGQIILPPLEAGEEAAPEIVASVLEAPVSEVAASSSAVRIVSSAVSGSAVVGSVIVLATQILIMRAMDAAEFENASNDINAKISRMNNYDSDVVRIMQGNHLLNKIELEQDIDFILGSGQRFDNSNLPSYYLFNGNGNWNNSANWNNAQIPPNPLPPGKEVFIENITGGECIINVPVTISNGARVTAKQGSKVRVTSMLTVPSFNQY